ncbi:MAG: putative serine/threonine protein kinase [Polyangiaceae bacterium]|nr:putative serine/threonine protein kinase [Polyangiaceae bacterium]
MRTLDQGGMGMVFEAEHARLRRRLAVKVLAQHLAKDAHALARFNREAEIISQLQHPHVVQVTDFDTTEQGEPYLVMELLTGESLATRLERERCITISDAVRIAHQVSSGLAAAHSANIVHRDLKPANIFLTQVAGHGTVVKLLDFGISKRVGASKGLTGEYDILGTPDYMAPEQALGKTALVDHRGDQYALAVITFEMLTGRTPFTGDDVMDVLRQVISAEPPIIEELAPHVPPGAGEVLRRAMSKDPDMRFASITDFAAALLRSAGTSLPPPIDAIGLANTLPAGPPGKSSPLAASSPLGAPRPASDRFETGRREQNTLAEAPAPVPHNGFTPQDLTRALDQARQAHGLGDTDLAVNNAETALNVADSLSSPEALARLESSTTLLNAIFEARLGPLSQRMVVLTPRSNNKKLRVSPEQAFLLSRVDGGVTLDEAIDLSPLPRQKTLRLLVSMMRQGLIAAE